MSSPRPRDLLEVAPTPPAARTYDLRATACNSRDQTMTQIYALLRRCCGYLEEDGTAHQSCLKLEVPRRSIFDLYSGLLAAELDLTHDSHLRLTGLCTLRLYHPLRSGNLCLQLDLTFPDEIDLSDPWAALGFA